MEYIAFVQNNLGALAFLARRWDQSTADYNAALATWRTQKNLVGVSRALNNLSLVAAAQHDFHTAQQRGEEALAASQQAKAQVEQVKILFSLGGIYLALGLDEQAYQSAQAALELADQLGDPLTATGGHIILAVAYLKQGELPAAYAQIQIAINLLETLQGSLTVPELKSTFLSQAADVYAIAALLAFQMEEPEQAFYYTEQGRARTFLDQIGNRRISKSGDHAALLQQELALRQRISQLQTALREPQNQSAAQVDATPTPLREELEAARAEYTRLLTDLKIVEPEYASLISVAALTLQEVQAQVLDEQTTLIIYYTFNDLLSDQTFAWVIDRQHAQLIPLNISRKALNNEITNMDNLISLKTFEPQASAQLYQAIFAPLKPYIHHPNLIIVPHQSIHYLPFAALWDAETQHYLLQDYAITYGPSASALRFILEKRNPNQGRLLALGNPNGSLPNAEAEVGSVAQLYNVKPLVRAQATESQVYNQAGKIDILHLAAHGVYDQLNPLFTRIELVPDDRNDGHLEVHEILNLNLAGTNLVVLSACETALGEQNNGDEIVSLTRAFLYAGTSSVVSTLWQVDDVASAKLMTAFYRYLRTGMTTAEALQAAQLEILRDESWQSPYYWAAFSLHGDYLGHDE